MKFFSDKELLSDGHSRNFPDSSSAKDSPLAQDLFKVSGVNTVLIGHDCITVSKDDEKKWDDIKPEVEKILTKFFSSGKDPIIEGDKEKTKAAFVHQQKADDEMAHHSEGPANPKTRPTPDPNPNKNPNPNPTQRFSDNTRNSGGQGEGYQDGTSRFPGGDKYDKDPGTSTVSPPKDDPHFNTTRKPDVDPVTDRRPGEDPVKRSGDADPLNRPGERDPNKRSGDDPLRKPDNDPLNKRSGDHDPLRRPDSDPNKRPGEGPLKSSGEGHKPGDDLLQNNLRRPGEAPVTNTKRKFEGDTIMES